MIARLRGIVLEADGDRVVLDVGGVGFEVGCPGPVAAQLSLKLGEAASLYTYLHVRDDILQLYGFASPRERSFFRMLISVSGVGPKVAVSILSAYPVADLELAVFSADSKRFESIPGIGRGLRAGRRPFGAHESGHDHHRGRRGAQGRPARRPGRRTGQARAAKG